MHQIIMNFTTILKQILNEFGLSVTTYLLWGDFNADFSKTSMNNAENYHGRKLQGITKSFGLINVITEPTRIAENSETLLDLILVSNESKILKAGTF